MMDAISKARALIAPLKDFTPGPWQVDAPEDESVEIAARIFAIAGLYETAPEALPDARLIAAAPALRDTVAALADLADALAQKLEAQAVELARAKSRGDNHWETLKGIRHIAKTSGDIERIILWVNDAGSGYTDRPEVSLAEVCDERNAARAEADAQAQENARLWTALDEALVWLEIDPVAEERGVVDRIRAALGDAP